MEKHIEPIKRAITKDRKKMCADLNMKWADLKPLFELEKRALAAGDMEDSDEGDDVITNMQEAWNYLRKGEVLNFLDVLDKELVKQPDYMAGESTGDGFEDDKSGPEKMQAAEAAETGNGASAPA